MHWQRPKGGKYLSDSVDGHAWQIERLVHNGHAHLDLLIENGIANSKYVAECASIAEARIIATCLEHADEIEMPDIAEHATDVGLLALPGFDKEVARELMAPLAYGPDRHLFKNRERLWFGAEGGSFYMAVDETDHFPVYGLILSPDRIIRPDFVCFRQQPLPKATAAAFAFGQLEILRMRQELNGSFKHALKGDQHHDLVDRFEDGFYAPREGSYRI